MSSKFETKYFKQQYKLDQTCKHFTKYVRKQCRGKNLWPRRGGLHMALMRNSHVFTLLCIYNPLLYSSLGISFLLHSTFHCFALWQSILFDFALFLGHCTLNKVAWFLLQLYFYCNYPTLQVKNTIKKKTLLATKVVNSCLKK